MFSNSVQYAFSIDGNLTPVNWVNVDAVYNDSTLMFLAQDGETGWLYAKVDAVPFNQDAEINNTIRFRATDQVGNQGIQDMASSIKIDTTGPGNFSLYIPMDWVNDQTPMVIGKF